MSIFQAAGARSVSVHPVAPDGTSAGWQTPAMLADDLDTLLGEKLLPLRIRQGDEDEPYLLAVDASGEPVVVEVVGLLDEPAVARALRYAGRAARFSAQDLAGAYRGGPALFSNHLEAFRATVPASSLLSTSVRGGARLLLVCSGFAEGVTDVLEFLLQPGWQVSVLQVQVVEGADGARMVDVVPLTRVAPPRRALEPTWLPLDRTVGVPLAAATPLYEARSTRVPTPASGSRAPDAWSAAAPAPAPRNASERRLAAVAVALGAPTALVWARPGGQGSLEALLHPDGVIELPDGSLHTEPGEAATAAGARSWEDGWMLWHLDEPSRRSLADVARQVVDGTGRVGV